MVCRIGGATPSQAQNPTQNPTQSKTRWLYTSYCALWPYIFHFVLRCTDQLPRGRAQLGDFGRGLEVKIRGEGDAVT